MDDDSINVDFLRTCFNCRRYFGLFSVSPIKALRVLSTIYVDLIRGIPLMVLAFFIYFGLPGVLGFNIPVFIAGIITLTLNASAYISEIVRGGIKAVPVGQMEASRSLGLSYNRTMQKLFYHKRFAL